MHFVCVHGVCHGGWCWEKTRADLEALGHQVSTPDLPLTSLEADAKTVTGILDGIDGASVLVGHSYGGLVISKAAATRTDVSHLVYVAAIMIGQGELFSEVSAAYPSDLGDQLVVGDNNTFSVKREGAIATFYNCCEPDVAAKAADRLRSTSFECISSPLESEPGQTIPSTYVLCSQDRAILPELQLLMSKRANNVVTIDTDHSPFYSSTDALLEVLQGGSRGQPYLGPP